MELIVLITFGIIHLTRLVIFGMVQIVFYSIILIFFSKNKKQNKKHSDPDDISNYV